MLESLQHSLLVTQILALESALRDSGQLSTELPDSFEGFADFTIDDLKMIESSFERIVRAQGGLKH